MTRESTRIKIMVLFQLTYNNGSRVTVFQVNAALIPTTNVTMEVFSSKILSSIM